MAGERKIDMVVEELTLSNLLMISSLLELLAERGIVNEQEVVTRAKIIRACNQARMQQGHSGDAPV